MESQGTATARPRVGQGGWARKQTGMTLIAFPPPGESGVHLQPSSLQSLMAGLHFFAKAGSARALVSLGRLRFTVRPEALHRHIA